MLVLMSGAVAGASAGVGAVAGAGAFAGAVTRTAPDAGVQNQNCPVIKQPRWTKCAVQCEKQ